MSQVLVYDPYDDPAWSAALRSSLAGTDVELVVPATPTAADAALVSADVVVATGRRRIGSEQLAALEGAAGIVCFSVGMDQVDLAAAAAAGIPVVNVPDYCTDEVSDHALTLLLAAQRRLFPLAHRAAAGDWDVHGSATMGAVRRLAGQTLGILGAGRVGRRVAHKARAFGFRTIACDPGVSAVDDTLLELVTLDELAARSDALVLCAALNAGSRGTVGEVFLSRVRPGLVLVNVARGGLVDEDALVRALDDGRVAVAALDVRAVEPPDPAADSLAGRPDVIVTPHMAGTSTDAFEDLRDQTAARILALLGRSA